MFVEGASPIAEFILAASTCFDVRPRGYDILRNARKLSRGKSFLPSSVVIPTVFLHPGNFFGKIASGGTVQVTIVVR